MKRPQTPAPEPLETRDAPPLYRTPLTTPELPVSPVLPRLDNFYIRPIDPNTPIELRGSTQVAKVLERRRLEREQGNERK